jgi:type III pantothenate kinase
MAVLLVDIGNTRIKWARLERGRLAPSRATAHSGWRVADYRRRLFGSGAAPARVLIASVASSGVNRALADAARRVGVAAEFLEVPRRAGGVTVGYLEPWRLGVDRFAAAVGAHGLFPRLPLCVVGVGTAMTVDFLDADGRHQGGVIIPAPALMVEALLERTHGIRRRARGGAAAGAGVFGRSTRAGIIEGARFAAAALIDRAVEEALPFARRRALVVLHGGEAASVRPLVRSVCVGVPDLVLRGLSVLAQVRPSGKPRLN